MRKVAIPSKLSNRCSRPAMPSFSRTRTYHAGAPNLTDRTRKAVMFGYGYMWLAPFDYKVMPKHVTDRLDPIGLQMVDALTDPAGRFIPGGIDQPLQDWCREHEVERQPRI